MTNRENDKGESVKLLAKISWPIGSILLLLLIVSCTSAPVTTVVDHPKTSVKSMLVVVELPNNVKFANKPGAYPANDVYSYQTHVTAFANKDIARVFRENGIDAKPFVLEAGKLDLQSLMKAMNAEDRRKWKYVLWLRHQSGTATCRSDCLVNYRIESWLIEVSSGKVLWKIAGDEHTPEFNEFNWQQGEVYRVLLAALAKDGMITLPSGVPEINMQEAHH